MRRTTRLLTILLTLAPGPAAAQWATRWEPAPAPVLAPAVDAAVRPSYRGSIAGESRARPSAALVAGEVLLGTAGAIAAGIAGYALFKEIANDYTVKGDDGYSPAGNVGYIVGSSLGGALAVYGIGRAAHRPGSLGAALIGAGVPGLALLAGVGDPWMPLYGVYFGAPAQGVAATIGLNLTLR